MLEVEGLPCRVSYLGSFLNSTLDPAVWKFEFSPDAGIPAQQDLQHETPVYGVPCSAFGALLPFVPSLLQVSEGAKAV